MLKKIKRDLCKSIAIELERNQKFIEVVTELQYTIKLFGHWKLSGSLKRATKLAQKMTNTLIMGFT